MQPKPYSSSRCLPNILQVFSKNGSTNPCGPGTLRDDVHVAPGLFDRGCNPEFDLAVIRRAVNPVDTQRKAPHERMDDFHAELVRAGVRLPQRLV